MTTSRIGNLTRLIHTLGSPYLQHRVATLLVQHGRRHQNHPTRNLFLKGSFLKSRRFRLCLVQAAVVNLFGVLHFRLPLYTRNGQVGEPSCCGFWLWSRLAAVVNLFVLNLLCFFSVCLYPKRADCRTHTYVRRRNKKDLAPPSRARGSTWGLFLQVC